MISQLESEEKKMQDFNIIQSLAQFLFEVFPYCKEAFFQDYLGLVLMFMKELETVGY